MDLADKIKTLRRERGMTLQQVGDIVGVSRSTVRKWECGMIDNIHRKNIAGLAQAFCVSPGYLMGWEENENPEEGEAAPSPVRLSATERELVFIYRNLNWQGQQMLIGTARAYNGVHDLQKEWSSEQLAR